MKIEMKKETKMKSLRSTIATFASLTLTLATPLGAQPALDEVEQKIEHAQQQVEKVQRKIEQAQQQAEKQLAKVEQAVAFAQAAAEPGELPEPPDVAFAFDNGGNESVNWLFGTPGRNAAPPLIVRSSNTDATVLSNIQEDLTVMSRLLNKNIEGKTGRDKRDSAMGIVLSAMPSSRRPQSVYLEGYGALFMVNVKFPLVATSAKEEVKSDKPVDTAWEETKRELYGPRERAGFFGGSQEGPAPEYDSSKVEDLKKDILESLKNATNIRNLKPEESIVVAVTGPGGEGGPVVRAKRTKKVKTVGGGDGGGGYVGGGGAGPARVDVVAVAGGSENPRQQTTLTIRVTKSDVDEYAKGNLKFEGFQKKAAISAY
jgi:hypothetical protein